MIRVAQDLLADYEKFNLIQLLQEATTVAAARGGDIDQYRAQANGIRQKAAQIVRDNVLNHYPQTLKQIIEESEYATAAPGRLASVILNGFPNDPNQAMSSSEVQLLQKLAMTLRGEFKQIVGAARKFNIEPITIPADLFSLDILLPRTAIDNEVTKLLSYQAKFVGIALDLTEIVTGKREPPKLVYTSTTDPVTAIAMAYGAAYAFLKLYKLALEVAEKQVAFLKLLKSLREVKPVPPEAASLEERLRADIAAGIPLLVDSAVRSIAALAPTERVNELKVSIQKNMSAIIEVVTKGGRLSITVENLDRLENLKRGTATSDENPAVTDEMLSDDIKERSALEERLATDTRALGDAMNLLLPTHHGDDREGSAQL